LRKDKTSRSYAAFVSLAFALINLMIGGAYLVEANRMRPR
jgi:hypothetical protein